MLLRVLVLISLLLPIGCSSTTYVYDVQVANQTSSVVRVGLVKHIAPGQPVVNGWMGPEHEAMVGPPRLDMTWGAGLGPHEGVSIGPRETDFSNGGYLRVYRSYGGVEELLGFTQDDPGRLDVPVYPGRTSFVIVEGKQGRLMLRTVPWEKVPGASGK